MPPDLLHALSAEVAESLEHSLHECEEMCWLAIPQLHILEQALTRAYNEGIRSTEEEV